tara:strand:- start:1612 stop:2427 length:816 start_codon:yes stop_codon:yes gene_type:complete
LVAVLTKYFYDQIANSLDECEKEFIYNSLEIANSGENSDSSYRFWFDDFRNNFKNREGDVYEFGVYRGSSLIAIALLAKRLGSNKHFYGFDTFSGFPSYSEEDKLENFSEEKGFSKEHIKDVKLLSNIKLLQEDQKFGNLDLSLNKLGKSGLFQNTSFDLLLEKIERFSLENVSLIKGEFKDTIPNHFSISKRKVFSANIDCDLYEGYKICLPFVFNNLVDGGFIHLDEYYSLKYPGAKIATDEFLCRNKNAILKKNSTRQGEFDRYSITN